MWPSIMLPYEAPLEVFWAAAATAPARTVLIAAQVSLTCSISASMGRTYCLRAIRGAAERSGARGCEAHPGIQSWISA